MTERFVASTGTISVANGASTVVGTGTLFGTRDRESAVVVAIPAAAAPVLVGFVAAIVPTFANGGRYDNFSLPLVAPYNGTTLTDATYVLVDLLAMANSASQAAVYARYAAFLEQNMGLVGNIADDIDYSLVPQNTLFVDSVTRTIWQWRSGILDPVYAVGTAFAPKGAWNSGTTYAANDLVEYSGGIFISNAAANLNHAPTVSPAFASDTYWTWLPLPTGGKFFDLDVFANGIPGNSELLFRREFTATVLFPAGLALSRFSAVTAATASAVLSLKRNGTEFGTVTFAAASATGVLAAAADTTFTPGDVLTIVAQSTADATLADISGTLRGRWDGGIATADLIRVLPADLTGANSNTAQPWFPSAGGVTVEAAKTYLFEGILRLSRAAGSTSHTTALLFGGTATLTAIDYLAMAKEGDANDLQDVSAFWATAATALVMKAASTSTTEQSMFRVQGVVRINAGGTFIPQFIYSAAPGGAPTVLRGSFFRLTPVGDNTIGAAGGWA